MNKSASNAKPITSPQVIDMFDNILCRYNPDYGLIFRLVIATGIDLKQACSLNVSDLYKKDSLTFRGMRNSEVVHTEPIPAELQERFNNAYMKRDPDSPAFLGNQQNRLFPQTFNHALRTVSKICTPDQDVTSSTLHKTFVYNIFLKDRKRAYKYTGCKYLAAICEYLHIDLPDPDEKHDYSVKESFYSSDMLSSTQEKFNAACSKIAEATENIADKDDSYFRSALALLNVVDNAVSKFNTEISE